MNELQQKQSEELKAAVQFCQDHNLFYKDELEKLKSNPKLFLISCMAKKRLYLAKHPEEAK